MSLGLYKAKNYINKKGSDMLRTFSIKWVNYIKVQEPVGRQALRYGLRALLNA